MKQRLVPLLALLLVLGQSATGIESADAEPVHLYQTVRGDTLIHLGRRLLIDRRRWPEIARANALRNPNRIGTGAVLRIPLRLMRTELVPATLLNVIGQASGVAGGALKAGLSVEQGTELRTGADGHVTLRLVDGTLLRLRPSSRLQVRESLRLPDARAVHSAARLEEGRVEVEAAPAQAGRAGFEIDTPQGVLGVRGTEFRVASDTVRKVTRGEVLGGTVAFSGLGAGAETQRVRAGFGAVVDATGAVAAPVRLLGAPTVAGLPKLHEKLLLRFPLPALEGAAAYRGQIARNAKFDDVVADLTSTTPELRFAGLPDGDYVLRVRAIDTRGLEGQDAHFSFRLKARPEAPLPSAPKSRAVLFGDRAEFSWAANDEAQSYRLQLASEESFGTLLKDLSDLRSLSTAIDGLNPGVYHWRLASVRADGDRGPWGASQSLDLRPLPPVPKPPAVGENSIAFSWASAPGQTFEFQVATERTFTKPVLERTLSKPSIELPLPGTGRFYVRLRARDPDGFVGPYTTPQHFDVPNYLRDSSGAKVLAAGEPVNVAP